MEAFKKRILAAPIMSLVILASLILVAKTSILEAVIILLVLLAVFAVIDFTTTSKLFSAKQARIAGIVVGVAAITGIGLWGAFAGIGTPIESGGNPELGDTPSAIVTDEAYDLGLFYFERGEYEKAIQTLNEIANNSNSYVEAQKLLAKAIDQYRIGLIDTAHTYVEKDDYKLAIEILKAGLLIVPDDAELLGTIEDYSLEYINVVRAAAIEDAAAYAAEEDYANALMTIQSAIDEVDSDVELHALYDNYIVQYRKDVLAKACQAYAEQDFQSSLSIIQNSLDVLPNDKSLMAYYDVLLSHKPAQLSDLVEIDESDKHYYDVYEHNHISDLLGNDPIDSNYSFGNDSWSGYSSGTGWVEFFLNKEYIIFQCSFLTRSVKPTYTFCVYGDDAELYNSGEINWEAGRQDISVNVKNINKLRILVKWSGGGTLDYGRFFMGNDLLYKELTDNDFGKAHS